MDSSDPRPEMLYGEEGRAWRNPSPCFPWFYPRAGFDKVLGKDRAGRPMLVEKQIDGAAHYFATQLALPIELLSELASKAGVRRYADNLDDQWWIGNDTITLYAVHSGTKTVKLQAGFRMEALLGPLQGTFQNGDTFNAIAGQAYLFLVKPSDIP
jgi:hypothetical protein